MVRSSKSIDWQASLYGSSPVRDRSGGVPLPSSGGVEPATARTAGLGRFCRDRSLTIIPAFGRSLAIWDIDSWIEWDAFGFGWPGDLFTMGEGDVLVLFDPGSLPHDHWRSCYVMRNRYGQ